MPIVCNGVYLHYFTGTFISVKALNASSASAQLTKDIVFFQTTDVRHCHWPAVHPQGRSPPFLPVNDKTAEMRLNGCCFFEWSEHGYMNSELENYDTALWKSEMSHSYCRHSRYGAESRVSKQFPSSIQFEKHTHKNVTGQSAILWNLTSNFRKWTSVYEISWKWRMPNMFTHG